MANPGEFLGETAPGLVPDFSALEVDPVQDVHRNIIPRFTRDQSAELYAYRGALHDAQYILSAVRSRRIPTADEVTEIDILFAKPMKLLTKEEFSNKTWWVERWLSQDAGAM